MAAIEVKDLSFTYPGENGGHTALANVNLRVERGEFLCIAGHSGCGKTTLLKILAGLLQPTAGEVFAGNTPLAVPGTDRAVVFQHDSLFPWLTARGNVAFGARQAGKAATRREAAAVAEAYLRKTGIWDARGKYPAQLSGGMQQRTALARALAMDSDILLLDEPFGALDTCSRETLQSLLEELWLAADGQKTVVMVTHDLDEALLLADRVVFLAAPGAQLPPAGIARPLTGEAGVELPVPIPRPRRLDKAHISEEFYRIKTALTHLFYASSPPQPAAGQDGPAASG